MDVEANNPPSTTHTRPPRRERRNPAFRVRLHREAANGSASTSPTAAEGTGSGSNPNAASKPIITTCCGCVSLRTGTNMIAIVTIMYGLWLLGSRLAVDSPWNIVSIIHAALSVGIGIYAIVAVVKEQKMGIFIFFGFMVFSAIFQIALGSVFIKDILDPVTQANLIDDCVNTKAPTTNDEANRLHDECAARLPKVVGLVITEKVLTMLFSTYFAFVVGVFAIDFSKNPERYTMPNLGAYIAGDGTVGQTFVIANGAYVYPPPQPQQYALPVYTPPLPPYEPGSGKVVYPDGQQQQPQQQYESRNNDGGQGGYITSTARTSGEAPVAPASNRTAPPHVPNPFED
ncbi:hypothetical protein HDU76_000311 [Blyttiomyces sp. JEL0837]|nr:hypothetical protein HDU76_000311 [Blyttiomyces sp. JEL0837]